MLIRPAKPGDGELLAGFRCSRGKWYEDEAEHFLNAEAIDLVTRESGFYQLLLVFEDEQLIGCAGYHAEALLLSDGTVVDSIRLQVLALATERQGVRLSDGVSLVEAVIAAVIDRATKQWEFDLFTAIVARENERCLAVLERLGSWSQVPRDNLYLRVTGRFRIG